MLAVPQVGALVGPPDLAQRVLERAVEVDHLAQLVHDARVLGPLDDAAAAAHEQAAALGKATQRLGLGIAKGLLALGGEDAGHAGVQLALDHAVHVDEAPVEHVAEVACHRGLARAEKADEEDVVAAATAREDARRLGRRRGLALRRGRA